MLKKLGKDVKSSVCKFWMEQDFQGLSVLSLFRDLYKLVTVINLGNWIIK
jgi:hypothetical protein